MREIIFRGQTRRYGEKVNMAGNKLSSRWVYGGIFPQNNDGDFAIIYQQEPEIEKFTVYADTVGQYTGVKDKNGQKIFEGDIIRVEFATTVTDVYDFEEPRVWYVNYEVYFDDCSHEWRVRYWDDIETLWEYDEDCEVVGNIFDNPELINPYVEWETIQNELRDI